MKDCVVIVTVLVGVAVLGSISVSAQKVTTPTIREPQTAGTHYFARDEKVVLKCRADGNPSYQWRKGGEVVKTTNNMFPINFDSRTGDLTIEKYSDYYNGDYYCVATIDDASSMSQTQTLYETRLPAFIKADAVLISVTAYAYNALPCSNQGELVVDPLDLSYNWYLSEESKQVQMDNNRLFIDKHGDLHFTYTKPSDATGDNLRYLCGYSTKGANAIFMGSPHILKVKAADPTGVPPVLQYHTSSVVAEVGTDAELECFFSGYDANTVNNLPTYKWFDFDNKEIDQGSDKTKLQLSEDRRVLTIHQVEETDDKMFYCQGFTQSGNTDKVNLYLNVTSKPVWVSRGPGSVTKAEKADAEFECNARSFSKEEEPAPPVWYINGRLLGPSDSHRKYITSSNKKTLTIKNLQKPEDIQCIQCTVENSIGTLMGDACLNVVSPIKVTRFPPQEQKIKKGDTIQLTVIASSDEDENSPLSYEWMIGNGTAVLKTSLPSYVTYDVRTDEVYINTSTLERDMYEKLGGRYQIKVFNLYDEKTYVTEVILTDVTPPPSAVAASAGIDMWIIGLIIGIIFLVIVIAIIIFVICRKQQEGDYNVDKKETGAGLDPEKELRDKGFNDLSRPDYDDYDYPEKKPRGDLEYDDVPIGGDDESLGEYGDEEDTHFNEDGSFIGIYQKKENERQHKTESTI